MAAGLVSAISNVVLCTIFIRGLGPIPAMGFIGAPLAMSVCDGLQMGVILALAAREDDFKSVWGSGWSSDALKGWGAYLRLGFPSLILFLVEWVSWDILVFLAGLLGPTPQAAQSALPYILNYPTYFVGAGLGSATTVLIGNKLGEGRANGARAVARVAFATGIVAMALTVGGMSLLREAGIRLLTTDAELAEQIRQIYPFSAAFSFLDGSVMIVLTGILIGAGQQGMAAPFIFLSYWIIGIPFGAYLAFARSVGYVGLWIGLLLGELVHDVSFAVLVCRIRWTDVAEAATAEAAAMTK